MKLKNLPENHHVLTFSSASKQFCDSRLYIDDYITNGICSEHFFTIMPDKNDIEKYKKNAQGVITIGGTKSFTSRFLMFHLQCISDITAGLGL